MSLHPSRLLRTVALSVTAFVASVPALAMEPNTDATSVFFGIRTGPGTDISGNAMAARDGFFINMARTSSYGFEQNLPNPVGGFRMNNPDGSENLVTIGGTARMGDADSLAAGRFNTTGGGSRWLDLASTSVSFTFQDPFAAIGFFLTDIGDFETELTISLRNAATSEVTEFDMTSRIGEGNNQSLAFFGYLDRTGATYNRMTITSRFAQTDRIGIDDITLGEPTQSNPVSAPGTLALAAAALGLLTLRRRA